MTVIDKDDCARERTTSTMGKWDPKVVRSLSPEDAEKVREEILRHKCDELGITNAKLLKLAKKATPPQSWYDEE